MYCKDVRSIVLLKYIEAECRHSRLVNVMS
jgi:hypothetical protein